MFPWHYDEKGTMKAGGTQPFVNIMSSFIGHVFLES